MTKPKMGRPVVGATTKKCSFSLNIEVLEDLKFIADTIGISRSAFLTMLLSESLPILKVSAAAIASGKSDPVSVAKRYSDDAKAILDERMNYLRANKNANKLSS